MSDETFHGKLSKLGFRLSREQLGKLVEEATKQRLTAVQVLEQVAEAERRARDAVNLARRTRYAMLGTPAALETFNWAHPKVIDRNLYEQLMTLEFLRGAHNILFRGTVGLGKTMLAQHIGLEALRRGYSVRFTTLASMTADILRQESLPAQTRRQNRYTRPDLLIIDELGYLPLDPRSADALYNVIAARHEKRSTIVTTNLAFKEWGTVFGEAGSLVALIDRFTQYLYRMEIEGTSFRDPKHRKAAATKPRPRR